MEIINHQFKVICDSQRDSLAAHKESLLYCKWKAKKAEVLIQNWMIKLAEFWSRLNSKIGNSTMSRPKPGFSKSGIGMSRFMHLKFLSTQILLTVLGLLVVVYSSLLKTSIPPLTWRQCRDLCLSIQHVFLKIYPILYGPPVTEDVKNPWGITMQYQEEHYMLIIRPARPPTPLFLRKPVTIHWRKGMPRNFKTIFIIQEPKVIWDSMSEWGHIVVNMFFRSSLQWVQQGHGTTQ